MDEGIGRTGYRLLAMLFAALGFLGVAALWLGVQAGLETVVWGGLALAVTAYVVLLAFTMVTPNLPRTRAPNTRAPRAQRSRTPPVPTAAPRPPAPPVPDFEYKDAVPAAAAAPERLVLPPSFHEGHPRAAMVPAASGGMAFKEHDPAAWPGQKTRAGKSHWTVERQAVEDARRKAEKRGDPSRFAEKYTRNTPMVRDILTKEGEKRVVPPDGKTRGKCGKCSTILLAPATRPLNLKCPTCGKVTRLTA